MMNTPLSIKEPEVQEHSFDLEALKEEGLQKIQELAGNNWTDFNFHDPGVTILEILCYALTDLAYRADFDIVDLLHHPGKKRIANSLFPPEDILSTAPLSILDFKRLILDLEGVKNCSIAPADSEKVIPGAFNILVEIHPDYEDASFILKIKDDIFELVHKNRPLGIVFTSIDFLKHDPVGVLLDVELTEDLEPEKIFSEFIQCVQNYFSPEIRFRSLQELLDQGLPTDAIFNGPVLLNGFLTDEELTQHTVRKRILISDLMSLAMAIPGVSFIRELKLIGANDESYNWLYEVKAGQVPRIDPGKTRFICRYKNTVVFESKPGALALWASPRLNRTSAHRQNTLEPAKGLARNLRYYHSIQNDFPETYGIGPKGPSAGAPPEKLAAIKQFKGYLMIYDQVMANFLAQVDHVKYLFSTEDIETSYAVQLMDNIPGIEFLYKQFIENYAVLHSGFQDKMKLQAEWLAFLKQNRDRLTLQIQQAFETHEDFLKRRNAVLDHLLARFGMDTLKLELLSDMPATEAIAYKLDLLRRFPKLSAEKYAMGPSSVSPNVSGLKAWIAKNLNLRGADKDTITASVLNKLDGENPENAFKLEVYTAKQPLNALLKYSTELENFTESTGNEVAIYDDRHELVSTISFEQSTENKKAVVYRKLRELDRESENLLVIDHFALKPSDELPCYGFNVLVGGVSFFISERRYSLKDCEHFLDEFTQLATQEEQFSIIETALKEFKIRFSSPSGSLLTRAYYSSVTEAKEQLDYFLDRARHGDIQFTYSTRYEDHYINVSNPFSYIVTVLLPAWPSKFQKEGFKKYTEEYLYSEFPSHLVVNIRWLELEAMRSFEQHWQHYKQSAGAPAEEQLKALDALMTALIS